MKVLNSPFKRKQYQIKAGYKHRTHVIDFNDTQNKDEWQKEVYEFAREIVDNKEDSLVIDIGCGSAYKLIKNFSNQRFIGVEVDPTLSHLKQTYPSYQWCSFEEIKNKSSELIICADVIEHVSDPILFLESINELDFHYLILSTPERDTKRGRLDYGPPSNPHHFREWNFTEFVSFISEYFTFEKHFISNVEQATQVILCKKKK